MMPPRFLARIKVFLDWIDTIVGGNKPLVYGIKYIPLACTFLMVIHIALLLLGYYEPITAGLAVFLVLVLLILLSYRFGFCRLHKAMIWYMVAMTACICIQKYDGFGTVLSVVRLIMFGVGCFLIGLACLKGLDDECY